MKRVLKKDGTCWVNIGDTYGGANSRASNGGRSGYGTEREGVYNRGIDKSLCMIPQRFAIEMINRGWLLRNVIIWHKPSCMPCSVKDRFTVDFEYMYFFVKNKKYYFEQQFDPIAAETIKRCKAGFQKGKTDKHAINSDMQNKYAGKLLNGEIKGRNKRIVWNINTEPFSDAHLAVYPPRLIETPIKAGCPIDGIILDPFIGSGTTALVSKKLQRHFVGIELNPEYVNIINKRLEEVSLLM